VEKFGLFCRGSRAVLESIQTRFQLVKRLFPQNDWEMLYCRILERMGLELLFLLCLNSLYRNNFAVCEMYEGWNFNSGNYLFTTDTK